MSGLTEDDLELAFLGWLSELGYACAFGPDLAPRTADEPVEPLLARAAEAAVHYEAVSSERATRMASHGLQAQEIQPAVIGSSVSAWPVTNARDRHE